MKLLIMFLLFCHTASATDYFVKNGGSDAANGLSDGTAWATIEKVNATSFSPGDQILFNKGDTWNEALKPISSGSAVNPIIIGAYGTGIKPVFTAFQDLAMNSLGNNLYSATATNSVKSLNTVLVNGRIAAKGRIPNSTYLLTTAPSTTEVINTGLNGTPNYSGGELVLQPESWISDVSRIASQSTGVLTLAWPVTYASNGNNRYFIQNLASLCDVQNDYAYDSTTKLLTVYSTTAPTVRISTIDTLVHAYKKDYITFENLTIEGANSIGIYRDTAQHITVRNCTIKYIGGYNQFPVSNSGLGGAAIRGKNSPYGVMQNDSLIDNLNNGISNTHGCHYDSIYNNYIRNTGIIAGMGAGSEGSSIAIHVNSGHKPYVYNNRIDSVGYNGIHFADGSDTALIKNNYVSNYCYNKGDGGGIYTIRTGSEGSIIRSNIVINGLTTGGNTAAGIYLDGNSRYITVDSNTVENGYLQAVLFHYPDHIEFHNNTIKSGIGAPFWYAVGGSGSNFNITRNVFYSTDTLNVSTNAIIYNYYGSLFGGSTSDSNYLLRPLKEEAAFRLGQTNTSYSKAGWTTATTYEAHSATTPEGITTAAGTLHINPTTSDSMVTFSGRKIDAKGNIYDNQVVLHPYQSIILFTSVTQPSGLTYRIGNFIFNQ